jgi:hypothetical protein
MPPSDDETSFELPRFSEIMAELDDRGWTPDQVREHVADLIDAAVDDLWQLSVLLYGPDFVDAVYEMSLSLAGFIGERACLTKKERKAVAKAIDAQAYQAGMVVAYQEWGHC